MSKMSRRQIPNVSVTELLYNQAEFIARSLESVFAQSYQEFEVVVVDDCLHLR